MVLVRLVHPVVVGRDKAGGLNLFVHVGLEELIDAPGFGGNVVGGHQFGLDGDAELVGRVAGKAETLAVVCDQFDGHDVAVC